MNYRNFLSFILAILIACNICFSLLSCEKNLLEEKTISFSELKEPANDIDIELLSYYPARNRNQSNFYIAKNLKNDDTLFILDKENSAVSDFIKNYNGVENTALVLRHRTFKKLNKYRFQIPSKFNLKDKKIYLGEIIRLIE